MPGYQCQNLETGHTTALIIGEQVSFGIEEPIRKVVVQRPRVHNPPDRWDYDKVVTHDPGGRLALVICSETMGQFEQRTRCGNARVRRIENLVADFVAGLVRTAVALRRQAERSKKREAEEQKRRQERAQLQKHIWEGGAKLEQFNKWVDLWERAEHLRRFISAYAAKSRSWAAEKQAHYKV